MSDSKDEQPQGELSPPVDLPLQQLGTMLAESRAAVVFTGAGISTESGIPDFRSPGGIWSQMKPIDFSDFMRSEALRRESWRRKFSMGAVIENAQPNRGHLAVARLVASGPVTHVITQNIDGLHQRAGVPDERVIELHGNSTYAKCLSCETRYSLDEIRVRFEGGDEAPLCNHCGGIIKTGTISFGQPMPRDAMIRAEKATLGCDMFLAIGSSLVVYPAAGFPVLAKQSGARLVILNREPTDLDPVADLVLHREIGPTLQAVTGG